jgi:hypothetical protein
VQVVQLLKDRLAEGREAEAQREKLMAWILRLEDFKVRVREGWERWGGGGERGLVAVESDGDVSCFLSTRGEYTSSRLSLDIIHDLRDVSAACGPRQVDFERRWNLTSEGDLRPDTLLERLTGDTWAVRLRRRVRSDLLLAVQAERLGHKVRRSDIWSLRVSDMQGGPD